MNANRQSIPGASTNFLSNSEKHCRDLSKSEKVVRKPGFIAPFLVAVGASTFGTIAGEYCVENGISIVYKPLWLMFFEMSVFPLAVILPIYIWIRVIVFSCTQSCGVFRIVAIVITGLVFLLTPLLIGTVAGDAVSKLLLGREIYPQDLTVWLVIGSVAMLPLFALAFLMHGVSKNTKSTNVS